jgi:polyhydroxyalkanoate synthesis regulator phasin
MSEQIPSIPSFVPPVPIGEGNPPHFVLGPDSTAQIQVGDHRLESSSSPTPGGSPALRGSSNHAGTPKQSRPETPPVTQTGVGQDELDLDSQLIDQTRIQIRILAQEIAQLAESGIPAAEFYQGFLNRLTTALASTGAAIWLSENTFSEGTNSPLKLQYHINLKQSVLATDPVAQLQHHSLLQRVLAADEPQLVSPLSGGANADEAGNPTDSLLVLAPLRIGKTTAGLVEIFQRANAGPATQQGYLRFVTQMAQLASNYLTQRQLKSFQLAQQSWHQLEQFIQTIHQGLDTRQTIYRIVNEGRRLLEVDRLSVALTQGSQGIFSSGKHCQVEAISGLDAIERRADLVKRLNSLTTAVVRTGQPLWYGGEDGDLPPQIEKKLHEYLDRSHAKMLAIIPLKALESTTSKSNPEPRQPGQPQPVFEARSLGALIIEQLKDGEIPATLQSRSELVVHHSQIALTNTLDHQAIFLLPVWKRLGKLSSLVAGERRWKTLAIAGMLGSVIAILSLFPYRFGMGASGSLIPETQYEVFALESGVLMNVNVSDQADTFVNAGDLLAEMYNNELDIEIENLRGQIERELESLRSKRALQSQVNASDAQILGPEINSLRQRILSLENELALREHQQKLLRVTAPASGQVINWQVRQNLLRRPVQRGQHLMTIVDPDTHWQLELRMPERRVAHLLQASQARSEPLTVSFTLLSQPGIEYQGHLLSIDQKLDVHSEDGNSVLVRIGFDNQAVPKDLLRSGTRVAAKVDCGKRSLGYVLLHEMLETIHTKWLLWF